MQCFLEYNLTKRVDASYSAFMANDIEFWVDYMTVVLVTARWVVDEVQRDLSIIAAISLCLRMSPLDTHCGKTAQDVACYGR